LYRGNIAFARTEETVATTVKPISVGSIERAVSKPLERQPGNTVIQQIARLLGQDPTDNKILSLIGEKLKEACAKKKNKRKLMENRSQDGQLVSIEPIKAKPKPLVPPCLQDEIEERQHQNQKDATDPKTHAQWTILMATNRSCLGNPALERAAR
jgi:hypothetical protein